jgi:acyl-CoA hydrolase
MNNNNWQEYYKSRCVSFADVAKQVKSGDFIGIGLAIGACSPPMFEAILARGRSLKGSRSATPVPVRPRSS